MKKVQKEVTLKLEYFHNRVDKKKGLYEGGVVEPDIEGLIIDVVNGESFDFEADEFIGNGKYEIQLEGSRKAILPVPLIPPYSVTASLVIRDLSPNQPQTCFYK
ncbi:hypothetical protein [Neobacillus soli]|uniref:hypothetical protein n=1 Tax=Neobacillus soli TaxID=220688 RepID=UPI000826BBE0|nr:hypothetical protein [Neobacillus soli]